MTQHTTDIEVTGVADARFISAWLDVNQDDSDGESITWYFRGGTTDLPARVEVSVDPKKADPLTFDLFIRADAPDNIGRDLSVFVFRKDGSTIRIYRHINFSQWSPTVWYRRNKIATWKQLRGNSVPVKIVFSFVNPS